MTTRCMKKQHTTLRAMITTLFALSGLAAVAAAGGKTERLSEPAGSGQSNNYSEVSAMSSDARYVAFHSQASNLVSDDTNGALDVFVRDRKKDKTTRVSIGAAGAQGDDDSGFPSISGDGRYIAFQSDAANLVDGDTNGVSDVFLYDRKKQTTRRVSIATDGAQADGPNFAPSISANGRYVAYVCYASNLVPEDTNGNADIMVFDLKKSVTTRASVATGGVQAKWGFCFTPSLSANGRFVAFVSNHYDLIPGSPTHANNVFVHDRKTGVTTRDSSGLDGGPANGTCWYARISHNGRFIAFDSSGSNIVDGDANGVDDVFVRDRKKESTTRISVTAGGAEVAGGSSLPAISGNGRYIAFQSSAIDLVGSDENGAVDVFLHDRKTGKTTLASVDSSGVQGQSISMRPAISKTGRYVTFESIAWNLIEGDTNGAMDIFLRDRKG